LPSNERFASSRGADLIVELPLVRRLILERLGRAGAKCRASIEIGDDCERKSLRPHEDLAQPVVRQVKKRIELYRLAKLALGDIQALTVHRFLAGPVVLQGITLIAIADHLRGRNTDQRHHEKQSQDAAIHGVPPSVFKKSRTFA